MKTWLKYLIELVVITISILAAFLLENYREELQQRKQGKESLRLIINEIRQNRDILESNIATLRGFNEYVQVVHSLNVKRGLDEGFTIPRKKLDSVKSVYLSNNRIQRLGSGENINAAFFTDDITIDFFLGQLNFSMWESSKFSGALIGLEPKILGVLQTCYSAFETDFGYSEMDYHKSLISDFDRHASVPKIINATKRLEQAYGLKLVLLKNDYDSMMKYLESYAKN